MQSHHYLQQFYLSVRSSLQIHNYSVLRFVMHPVVRIGMISALMLSGLLGHIHTMLPVFTYYSDPPWG